MKTFPIWRVVAIQLLISLLAGPASAGEGQTLLSARLDRMDRIMHQTIEEWRMSSTLTEHEALSADTADEDFRTVGLGFNWSDKPATLWLRARYTVPETALGRPVAGMKISFQTKLDDSAMIFVNGQIKSWFRVSNDPVVLTESAVPGEEFLLVIKATRKTGETGAVYRANILYSGFDELYRRSEKIVGAASELEPLLELSGEPRDRWAPILDRAGEAIDLTALEAGRFEVFYASVDRCRETLLPLGPILKRFSIPMAAYSHIDLAWLWDRDEGENVVVKGTSENVLNLMKDYPDFVYAATQMHAYRWMERDYPELFARIKEKIAEGKWEPVGAQWVESDHNLPSGESVVRQFLYGRKYSLEKFGVASSIGFTPDTFGYNWNLPQILAKSDMRGFVTQKLSWNDTTKFPDYRFWWEAPDGSRVFVHFPQGGYGEGVDGPTLAAKLAEAKRRHGVDTNLVMYGKGDHGGGIPRDWVKRAYELRDEPLFPQIRFSSIESAFDEMLEQAKDHDIPIWNDELYLEYHRGTYTSHADVKNNNRRNEARMMNAEIYSSIASIAAGKEYPFDRIEEAWKLLLFNQFHDILPGDSIAKVFEDSAADHAIIKSDMNGVIDDDFQAIASQADTTGQGRPLVLFNSLSWARDELVEVELSEGVDSAVAADENGRALPTQIIWNDRGGKSALFVARDVPAMGFSVYRLVEGKAGPDEPAGALSIEDYAMENQYFRVEINPAGGNVSRLYDKRFNREIVAPGKGAFELQAYRELPNSTAWDPFFPNETGFPPDDQMMEIPAPESVEIMERGPVRVTFEIRRPFGEASRIAQRMCLVDGLPVVYAQIDADWRDRFVFLKTAFDLNLDADYATYEIPYAAIRRSTKPQTPAEKAKWEASGHRWVDYTDKSGDYGATLLSYNKYGYDVLGSRMRMSLLRGTHIPDPDADKGLQTIPYALYPHSGGLEDSKAMRKGREYNSPLILFEPKEKNAGPLGKRHSFFSIESNNIVLSTIKKAENGEGFIFRLAETAGKDGSIAVLELTKTPKRVVETNLVERDLKDFSFPERTTLAVPMGRFEIKSIRIVF